MIINAFQYFRSSNPFPFVRANQFFMERKSRLKTERSQEDLDQKITDFHTQNEEEREKAFLDLIGEVIVQATLKEYYETTCTNERNSKD